MTFVPNTLTLCSLTFNPPPPPPVGLAMEVLVNELAALLKLLDQETLSSSTQEKKTSVRKLLQQISPAGQRITGLLAD